MWERRGFIIAEKKNVYANVTTYEGLKGMREKPAMYLGSTGVLKEGHAPRALIQMAQEVMSNSFDEALAGYGNEVIVKIGKDQSMTVIDFGRGMPKGPDDSFDSVIRAATAPHTSGKFDNDNYAGQNTTGTHGIGLKATNAISKRMIVSATTFSTTKNANDEIVLDGGLVSYEIVFEQDTVVSAKELKRYSKSEYEKHKDDLHTGTTITFYPDDTILESVVWTNNDLLPRLEASAFLFPGVVVKFIDERTEFEQMWQYKNGLADYVKQLSRGESTLSTLKEPIHIDKLSEVDKFTFKVSASLTYTDDVNAILETYANGVPTKEGGPHVEGFESGLLKAINDFAQDKKLIKQSFRLSDVKEGIIAALHVQVPSKIMEFEGQTKEKLATVQAKAATHQAIYDVLTNWLYDNLDSATQIVEKTEASRQAREAAANSRKDALAGRATKRTKSLEISSKLKKATSKDPEKCEMIITEGDSASNVKRDPRYQAILGIRGKILNAYELSLSEAIKNTEISTIIAAIGAGAGSNCDASLSNYRHVLIATDADDDGSHICVLLLGLFYRFMRPMIEAGKIGLIIPPLYKAEKYVKGKPVIKMYFTEQELQADRKKLEGYTIQRYKGLGEMDKSTEAYDAITNYETRQVKIVTIEDALKASQTLKILLGNDASLRANWVEQTINFDELVYD